MKIWYIAIPILVVLRVCCLAEAQDALGGTLPQVTYTNAHLGFSYLLPEGFYSVDQNDHGHLGTATLLLIADRHTGTPIKERLLLAADQSNRYNWGPTVYVAKFADATAAQAGVNILRQGVEEFGGQRFPFVEYTQSYSGVVLYKTFSCTKIDGYFVSWTFAAASQERLHDLTASLKTVAFKKH